jgi:hypothetical protein
VAVAVVAVLAVSASEATVVQVSLLSNTQTPERLALVLD